MFLTFFFFLLEEDIQGFCLLEVFFVFSCVVAAGVFFPFDKILLFLVFALAAYSAIQNFFYPIFFLAVHLNQVRAADF